VVGEDGQLDQVFSWRFRVPIAAGQGAGAHIPVQIRARDSGGFQVTQDTFVVVVP
jgi:hypothetical protein